MINVVVSGILGKMGSILASSIEASNQFKLVAGYDQQESLNVFSNLNQLPKSDVIIDFSHPLTLDSLLDYAVKHHIPLVLATTGYNDAQFIKIKEASKHIPIFYSANYSVGVYLVQKALKSIVKHLDDDYDIEIVEIHHRFKKDAPSGTAIKLYDTINESNKTPLKMIQGESQEKGVKVHSLRLGNVVGEHEVLISSLEEIINIKHTALNKSVFAKGALKAAQFLVHKPIGLYGMDDLLGDNHE